MIFNDPCAVLDEMEKLMAESRLLKETLRSKGNGSKTAARKLRKMTYVVQVLGKHFRDLTNAEGNADKLSDIKSKFAKKWADLQAPAKRISKKEEAAD